MHIANWPATLDLSFAVKNGSPVRVELVASRDLNRFVRGKTYEFLIRLSSRASSQFQQLVPDKGDYDIILINEGSQNSAINVSAAVQFAREPDVARYVSPQRRAIVITVSVAVFLIGLIWSGLALLRAMRTASEQVDY